jgi:archaellin
MQRAIKYLRGDVMKYFDNIKGKLILAIIVVILIVGIAGYTKISMDRKTILLSNKIEEKVLRLVELSTVKYNYTNIVEYEDKVQLSGISVPFTNKKFIVKYSGYIKAGVDLSTIEVNVKNKDAVEIKMDKPQIFENVIPEEEVYFYDERDSIFNKLSFKDLYVVLIQEKEKMKEEVIQKGILNDAEKNGTDIITSLLEGMGFKNISITFR